MIYLIYAVFIYFKQKKRPLFKCIHVGAAAIKPPKEFLDHLEVGGRLVIPLGTKNYNTSDQFIYFIDKLSLEIKYPLPNFMGLYHLLIFGNYHIDSF